MKIVVLIVSCLFVVAAANFTYFTKFEVNEATVKLKTAPHEIKGKMLRPRFSKRFSITNSSGLVYEFSADDIENLSYPIETRG